jgi:hypothetical protein
MLAFGGFEDGAFGRVATLSGGRCFDVCGGFSGGGLKGTTRPIGKGPL